MYYPSSNLWHNGLAIRQPLAKFLEDLVKLPVFRLVGVLDRFFLLSYQASNFNLRWLTMN